MSEATTNVPSTEVKKRKARAKLPCNVDFLKDSLVHVEATGPLANRALLYKTVSEHYNTVYIAEPKISPSIAMLRIEEFKLEMKTPIAPRGRPAGSGFGRKKMFVKVPIELYKAELNAAFVACEGNNTAQEHILNLLGVLNEDVETLEPIEEEIPRAPYEVVKDADSEAKETIQEAIPA